MAASLPEIESFRAALDALQKPVFAVLDGAHFDDLEDELGDAGITSRSLFLRGGDEAMRRDGPWLVALADGPTRAHIEALALEKPCAVFWSCPQGEEALWRHLRTINRILVPDDRIPANDGRLGKPVKYERVLFRHWDPNVLGSFLPWLSVEQFARIFGPATAILMNATDYGGLRRAPRPEDMPPAPRGLLKIEAETIKAIENSRFGYSNERIVAYLRQVAPDHTRKLSQAELDRLTLQYFSEARSYGISSEANIGRWSYMQIVTGGKLTRNPDVVTFMTADEPSISPDMRVRMLLQASQEYAKGSR